MVKGWRLSSVLLSEPYKSPVAVLNEIDHKGLGSLDGGSVVEHDLEEIADHRFVVELGGVEK